MEIQELGKIFKKVSAAYNWGELKYAIDDTDEGTVITFYFENANSGLDRNGASAIKVYKDWNKIAGDVETHLMEYGGVDNAVNIFLRQGMVWVPIEKRAIFQLYIEDPDEQIDGTEITELQAVKETAEKILDAFKSAQVDMKEVQTIQQNSAGLSLKDRLAQVGELQFSIDSSKTEFCILDILFSGIRDDSSPYDLCKKLGLVETRKQITDGLARIADAVSGFRPPIAPQGTILRYCFAAGATEAVKKFVRDELGGTEIVASAQFESPVPPPVAPASVSSGSVSNNAGGNGQSSSTGRDSGTEQDGPKFNRAKLKAVAEDLAVEYHDMSSYDPTARLILDLDGSTNRLSLRLVCGDKECLHFALPRLRNKHASAIHDAFYPFLDVEPTTFGGEDCISSGSYRRYRDETRALESVGKLMSEAFEHKLSKLDDVDLESVDASGLAEIVEGGVSINELIDGLAEVSVQKNLGRLTCKIEFSKTKCILHFGFENLAEVRGLERYRQVGFDLCEKLTSYFGSDDETHDAMPNEIEGQFFWARRRTSGDVRKRMVDGARRIPDSVNKKIKAMGGGDTGAAPASVSSDSVSANASGRRRSSSPKRDTPPSGPKFDEAKFKDAAKALAVTYHDIYHHDPDARLVLDLDQSAHILNLKLHCDNRLNLNGVSKKMREKNGPGILTAFLTLGIPMLPGSGDCISSGSCQMYHGGTKTLESVGKLLTSAFKHQLSKLNKVGLESIDTSRLTKIVEGIAEKCFDEYKQDAKDLYLVLECDKPHSDSEEMPIQLVLKIPRSLQRRDSHLVSRLRSEFDDDWEQCWRPLKAWTDMSTYTSYSGSIFTVQVCDGRHYPAVNSAKELVTRVFRNKLKALIDGAGKNPDSVSEKITAMGRGNQDSAPASVPSSSASADAGGHRRSGSKKHAKHRGGPKFNRDALKAVARALASEFHAIGYRDPDARLVLALDKKAQILDLKLVCENKLNLNFILGQLREKHGSAIHDAFSPFLEVETTTLRGADCISSGSYKMYPAEALESVGKRMSSAFKHQLSRLNKVALKSIDAAKLTNVVEGIAKKCFDADRHEASNYKLILQYQYSPFLGDDAEVYVLLAFDGAEMPSDTFRHALGISFQEDWAACWQPIDADLTQRSGDTNLGVEVLTFRCKARYHDALAAAQELVSRVFREKLKALIDGGSNMLSAGSASADRKSGHVQTPVVPPPVRARRSRSVGALSRPIPRPVVRKIPTSTSAGADQKSGPVQAKKVTTAMKLGNALGRLNINVYYQIIDGPKNTLELMICSDTLKAEKLKDRQNSLHKPELLKDLNQYFVAKFGFVPGAEGVAGTKKRYDVAGAFFRCFVPKNNRAELLRKLKKMNLQSAEERASDAQKS